MPTQPAPERPTFLGSPSPGITRLRSGRSPPDRKSNYVAVSGGAAHIKELAGGLYALAEKTDVLGCVGTSAGSFVAAAWAFGVCKNEMEDLVVEMLQENKVLDFSVFAWQRYGLCRWDAIKETVRSVWGPGTRLGESAVPLAVVVSDTYTKTPRVFSSWATPRVKLDEVLAASSAIPFLAAAQMIPSADTGNRLYCDGGVSDNFALDVFADKNEPTVGLCLYNQTSTEVTPVRSLQDYVMAIASLALWESADVAARKDERVIALHTKGSGFNFNQKPADIRESIESGRQQVLEALKKSATP